MADNSKERCSQEVSIINKYATPLAILLVGMGLASSQPMGYAKTVGLSLLIFSLALNLLLVPLLIKKQGELKPWVKQYRMMLNVAVNVTLVYVLGGHWYPMWLLLVLTPLATAVYGDRKKTLLSALGISLALFVINAMHQLTSPIEWAKQVAHASFIILISLMINELMLLRKEKS